MLVTFTGVAAASGAVAGREADPVVLTGAQTPALIGIAPDEVVAFSWNGAWKQIPVQVDERKIADYRVIRNTTEFASFKGEVYADPGTWTGADGVPQMTVGSLAVPVEGTTGDANLDQDDEIALMSKDSGLSARGKPDPAGVDGTTRTPVRIKDPLANAAESFVYLFEKTSGLDPAAGTDYVSYDLEYTPALVPDYFEGYDFDPLPGGDANGTPGSPGPVNNPEASVVETGLYSQTFPGKWMVDGLRPTTPGATGVDILDGDKSTVGTTNCERNELTFSRGGGGVIAAIDGPVRAIRSYIGANSGTYTQRDQIYYEGLADTETHLRVHPGISDVITAMDYSEDAFGMTYRNSLNPAGVKVDGVPDPGVKLGELSWEQMSGEQGSITLVSRVQTDIESAVLTSYYQDDFTPTENAITCSGDGHAIGASGPRINGTGSANTDPVLAPPVKYLTATRQTYVDPIGATKEVAIHHSQQVDSPLVISTGAGTEPTGTIGEPGPGEPGKPGRTNWAGLKVNVKPARVKAAVGARKLFRVKVRNVGDLPGRNVRVCPRASDRLVRTGGCRKVRKLRPGKARSFRFRATLRRAAEDRRQVRVRFRAKARNSRARVSTGLMIPRS